MRLWRSGYIIRWAVMLAAFAIIFATVGQSSAQEAKPLKGAALIVGNGEYAHLPALTNPTNDARAVEELFDALGFDTSVVTDRDARRLKRDLEVFAEDAEGADVAVLYYAGHGIEAGGENYLVPVDADVTALDAAADRLVPLSAFIDKLKTTVPVTIMLLDACRNSPFPAGAMVRMEPGEQSQPVNAVGLGGPRGAASLSKGSQPGSEQLGTVIGFAAEPGHAALDGEPGQNSPYAAAVLKHLSAIGGDEFGTVMRLVAEEVYLKTSGRQRPWVNESLRRLLYFGKAVAGPQGEEGEILTERRQLLLTIAALPGSNRRQVETVAADGGVPMDALYGMLKALGTDSPEDPAELDKMLRSQTERLKTLLAERQTLKSPDPEIIRLSRLADEAMSEGALATALRLHEQTKARVKELKPAREQAKADLGARLVEDADVYARSAAAHEIAFDYRTAADDYAEAFRSVEGWDDELAWKYKIAETNALTDHGHYKGDNAALAAAIAAAHEALRLAPRANASDNWAATQNNLGNALSTLGGRESGTARLEEAVTAYRAALEERTRKRVPLDWAQTQNNLGNALWKLGERESGTKRLEEAVTAFRAALEEYTRERAPLDWAQTQNNLGVALAIIGGERESGTERLEEAVAAFRAGLEQATRERVPLNWAMTQSNLGNALWRLGQRESGTERLEEAVTAYRAALEEYTRERVPLQWAMTQNNLGNALQALGERESGTARLKEAITAFRAAHKEQTRERVPLDWAQTQNNLGNALWRLGESESGTARLEEAVTAYRAALEEYTRERMPLDWAGTQYNLGAVLIEIGKRTATSTDVEEGRSALAASWEWYAAAGYVQYNDHFAKKIAEADRILAEIKN